MRLFQSYEFQGLWGVFYYNKNSKEQEATGRLQRRTPPVLSLPQSPRHRHPVLRLGFCPGLHLALLFLFSEGAADFSAGCPKSPKSSVKRDRHLHSKQPEEQEQGGHETLASPCPCLPRPRARPCLHGSQAHRLPRSAWAQAVAFMTGVCGQCLFSSIAYTRNFF